MALGSWGFYTLLEWVKIVGASGMEWGNSVHEKDLTLGTGSLGWNDETGTIFPKRML